MERLRYVSVIVLTAVIVLFALQNLDAVAVTLLWWEFRTSVSLIALAPFLIGLLVGGATALYYRRRRHGGKPPAEGPHGGTEQAPEPPKP